MEGNMSGKCKLLSVLCAILFVLVMSHPSSAAITYTYDNLNRIIGVDYGDGYSDAYTYDSAGNRLTLATTETTPPHSEITYPSNGAVITDGSLTISGTATDSGGAGVQKVELSIDGGANWTLATGTTSWTYHVTFPSNGTYQIMVRTTDNVGNAETTTRTITVDANALDRFVLYDDFSANPAVIDNTKWGQYESIREIAEGQLRFKARSSRNYTSPVSLGVLIQNPATVSTIEADMILHAFNNTEGARPQLTIQKTLYNDGTGTNYLGEVTASVIISGSSQSPPAVLVINRKITEDGSQSEHLFVQSFSTLPVLDTLYSASIAWNGSAITGTFNGESLTYTPGTAIQSIHHPSCTLMALVDTNYANGVGKEATIEGFLDNVKVNGATYDDFSASKIDETKWIYYDYAREINEGKLRLEARSSTPYTSSTESYLNMLRPNIIRAIQSTVRLTSYDNQHAASCNAQVLGRFFNDGSAGGGFTGDYFASVFLGGSGTSPRGYWQVIRYNGTTINTGILLSSGVFTTPIATGVDYTLSVEWDGSKFIFKIDGETKEYTPVGVSTFLPANQPVKAFDAFIFNNSGKEATIEALFDDVRIVESSSLYADLGSLGLWKHDGTSWIKLAPENPEAIAASGSILYADLGSFGLWKHNGTAWSKLAPENPEAIAVSGSTLYADLGAYGIWKHDGNAWSFLAPENPEQIVASGSDLYADLGSYGIWKYNGTSWIFLALENPEQLAVSGSTLYADLGSYGIWKYSGSSWSLLAPENPEQIVVSGNTLYADLGSYGIWKYNGSSWSFLAPENPENLVASSTDLYADLGSLGIWKYNGTSWSFLAPENPEALAVGE
jgi:hypothetical protein